MKITDNEYSYLSDKRSAFLGKIKNIQDRSTWEEVYCDELRYTEREGTKTLLIGESYLPPFVAKNPSVENIIASYSKDFSEDPMTLIERATKDEGFIEKEFYPITDFALSDLIERAKVGQRFREREYFLRNIDAFNDALWTAGQGRTREGAKIYKIDGTVFAIPSENYVPLPMATLVETLEGELSGLYKSVRFESGFYCHEIMYVDFSINDQEIIDAYQKALKQFFYKPRIIVRLVTSNLGFSGANLYPMLEYSNSKDGERITVSLGENIILPHKGLASLDGFVKNVQKTFPLIASIPEKLAVLNDIKVKHPIHCLINVGDKCGIPAKYIAPVAEMASALFSGKETNARQIYLLLSKTLGLVKDEKDKIRVAEKVGRAVRLMTNNIEDVDITKIKWVSLANIVVNENQDVFNKITEDADASSLEQMSFEEVA